MGDAVIGWNGPMGLLRERSIGALWRYEPDMREREKESRSWILELTNRKQRARTKKHTHNKQERDYYLLSDW